MKISIDFGNGISAELTGDTGLEFLSLLRMALLELAYRSKPDSRCPECIYGRLYRHDEAGLVKGYDYCDCPTGRDLKRVESRIPQTVGGADA